MVRGVKIKGENSYEGRRGALEEEALKNEKPKHIPSLSQHISALKKED